MQIVWTALECVVFYGMAALTVRFAWPLGRSVMEKLSEKTAARLSNLTSLAVFAILTHLGRGAIQADSIFFRLLFGCACLSFALSTIHPKQFSVGAANLNLAFFYVYIWQIAKMYM